MGFEDLYQWVDPVKSGVLFGSVFVTLISICYYSLISVAAYTSLALLLVVGLAKLVTYIAVTFLKKEMTNPIQRYAGVDVTVSQEKVNECASKTTDKINCTLKELRRLFLVENMLDSIKFGLCLWCLTYIGSWFNAMTLIIMSWVGLFTLPKVYVLNKEKIDPIWEQVQTKLNEVQTKIGDLIPNKAKAAEAKKEE